MMMPFNCSYRNKNDRMTTDSYQGDTANAYKTWLEGIDPKTAGKPAYESYISAKVTHQFKTGWGVWSCTASQPTLPSSL
jgi:hypothetical protein